MASKPEMHRGISLLRVRTSVAIEIQRAKVLVACAAVFYPVWGFLQHLTNNEVRDSSAGRFLVSGIFLFLYFFEKLPRAREEVTLRVIQSGRWILTAHYFTLVARNGIAVQYAMDSFLLVFAISSLFSTRKWFGLYALFVAGLAALCSPGSRAYPVWEYQVGLAVCLGASYFGFAAKLRAMETLQESEDLFRTIFQSSGIGVIVMDAQERILIANQAMSNLLGRAEAAFLGKRLPVFFAEAETTADTQPLRDLILGTEDAVHFETKFSPPAPSAQVWVRVTATRMTRSGVAPRLVAMVENITTQKEAEAKVVEQQQKLLHSAKMTALGEMAGGIAHEINNPLAIIAMQTTILQELQAGEYANPSAVSTALPYLHRATDRIAKIVRGLRLFAQDRPNLPFEKVSTASIIEQTVGLCGERFRGHRIQLGIQVGPDEILECRENEISQVLLNLLNNAFDAVVDTKDAWVRLRLESHPAAIRIVLTDSGPGIPPPLREKIMQPFFTTKPVGKGAGLGLSISKGIIESHGGRLFLDPSCANTRFVIELPRKQTERSQARQA